MSAQKDRYNTIAGEYEGEITEKRSRFIAYAVHIESEEDALKIIEAKKKQYWDARHNCYAYILGKDSSVLRFSDDGEPSGTAGKPILEVLKNKGLTDTLIVVTRYFGGVLLGTGGLIRAYTDSSLAAIAKAESEGGLKTMCLMQDIDIKTDYTLSGKVQYNLSEAGVLLKDTIYEEAVRFAAAVPLNEVGALIDKITDVTGGKAEIRKGDMGYFPLTK